MANKTGTTKRGPQRERERRIRTGKSKHQAKEMNANTKGLLAQCASWFLLLRPLLSRTQDTRATLSEHPGSRSARSLPGMCVCACTSGMFEKTLLHINLYTGPQQGVVLSLWLANGRWKVVPLPCTTILSDGGMDDGFCVVCICVKPDRG